MNLRTLGEYTAQKVFDKVAEHLIKQGKKSISKGMCMYRSPDGSKCAAGFLISDEEYRPNMENKPYQDIIEGYNYSRKHLRLISDLQLLHDSEPVYKRREQLVELAIRNNLSIDKVKKL